MSKDERTGLQEQVRELRAGGVTIGGDVICGHKVGGDKVAGDKIVVSGDRRWESLKPLRGAEDAER